MGSAGSRLGIGAISVILLTVAAASSAQQQPGSAVFRSTHARGTQDIVIGAEECSKECSVRSAGSNLGIGAISVILLTAAAAPSALL